MADLVGAGNLGGFSDSGGPGELWFLVSFLGWDAI